MFWKRYRLFAVYGFDIRIDASWFVLAFLVTWTLGTGFFPAIAPGFSPNTYWAMGVLGALGLFGSIVLHELAHAVVARRNDIPMKGITLFIFGGVAEMGSDPPSAGSELRMAAAGPVASVFIGGILYLLSATAAGSLPASAVEVVRYLSWLNLILAAFNLIPAFPLDGGRILRAYLWHRRGSLRKATQTSSRVGSAFGLLLMALGIASFLAGMLVPGLWYFVLGLFLRRLARSSYQQILLKETLQGEPVGRFMKRVGDIAAGCSVHNTIDADVDAMEALKLMRNTGSSRLLVTKNGSLEGVITLKDLLEFFSLRMEPET